MITNMTWAQYWTIILILTILYYAVIFFTFYRHHLVAYVQRFSGNATDNLLHENESNKKDDEAIVFEENDYPLLNDIKETLQQAFLKRFSVAEIIFSIQITISKYNAAMLFQKQDAINHFIQNECNKICSIHLDNEGLRQVWIR